MRAHPTFLLMLVAAAAGCPRATPGPSATAEPAAPPNTAAASGAPAPPPSASSTQAEGQEPPNVGCALRKNTGVLSACEKNDRKLGRATLTPEDVDQAMKIAKGICYCAAGLDRPAAACTGRLRTGSVKLTVGKLGDPTDCTISLSAAEWHGRRWIVIDAFNRDQATFYSILTILERLPSGLTPYYSGFNGLPDAASIASGAEGVSAAMKLDWPGLPADLRAFLGGT